MKCEGCKRKTTLATRISCPCCQKIVCITCRYPTKHECGDVRATDLKKLEQKSQQRGAQMPGAYLLPK